MAGTRSDASVRDRLLEAANDLFYEEGVRTVGIDRVLERAGVAKASLYDTFGSKEELVRVYLEQRSLARRERISLRIAQYEDPRARILSVFDLLGEIAAEASFRGCALVKACAEGPRGVTPVRQVASDQRQWLRGLFTQLATDFGADDPVRAGRQLALLYEGAVIGAWMDSDPGVPGEARVMADCLLDAHVARKTPATQSEASGASHHRPGKARERPPPKRRAKAS